MHLIHDKDAMLARRRVISHGFVELTDVIDPSAAGGIDFLNIG